MIFQDRLDAARQLAVALSAYRGRNPLVLAIPRGAVPMGAALAGGVGVGLYPDFAMASRMNPVAEVVEPDPAAQSIYAELYPIFLEAYQALVPVYDHLAGREG